MLAENSTFVDQQTIKLQERPEMVPTGDMPRHVQACLDRFLVDRVKPGTRVKLTGVYCIHDAKQGKKNAPGPSTIIK